MPLYPDSPNPASYSAPLLDFSPIGNLATDYYKGAENKRDYDLKRAFKDGLPTLPGTNIPDIGQMAQTLARLGGVDNAVQLANAAAGQQAGVGATDFLLNGGANMPAGGGGPPAAAPGGSPTEPRGVRNNNPGNIENGSFASRQPGYTGPEAKGRFATFATPEQGISAATNLIGIYGRQGINTIQGVVSKWAPAGDGSNNPTAYAATVAKAIGIAPDAPIDLSDPQLRSSLARAMFTVENGKPVGGGGATPPPATAKIPAHGIPDGEDAAPASPPASGTMVAGPGAPAAAAPQAPAPQPAATPAPSAQPQAGLSGDPTLGGLVPAQWIARGGNPQTYLDALLARAASPNIAANAKEALLARAKAVQDTMTKWNEPTPELKNFRADARPNESLVQYQGRTEGEKKYASGEAERYGKKYDAIQEAGSRALADLPQLGLAKTLMDDPSFYSGVGEKYNLIYKRLLSTFGGDPNVAAPQEAFKKIVSNSILEQIKGLAGTGQIRVAEIKIMEQAAANLENTPAANKVLVEIASRLQGRAADLAAMAQNYKGGRLDAGFDRLVRTYDQGKLAPQAMKTSGLQRQGTLLTDDEIKNFRELITPKAADNGAQPAATPGTKTAKSAPAVGAVEQGYRFKGGDPAKSESWAKVQ